MEGPILVLSGNGKTGSRVAARLRERAVPVRIGSRSGEPPFDWEDESTWARALRGAFRRLHQLPPRHRGPGLDRRDPHAEQAGLDGVREALGRAPRGFADYARATAASGACRPEPAVL